MKRTRLHRYTRIRRFTPLQQRSRTNKRPPAESAYLRWIRSLRCVVCEALAPNEAAHTKVLGRAGLSRKASNRSVIPLCAFCHRLAKDSYHQLTPEDRWASHHSLDLTGLVQRLNGCFELLRIERRPR